MRLFRRPILVCLCSLKSHNHHNFTQTLSTPILFQSHYTNYPIIVPNLNHVTTAPNTYPTSFGWYSGFSTLIDGKNNDPDGHLVDTDEENEEWNKNVVKVAVNELDLEEIMGILRDSGENRSQARNKLDQCDVKVTPELVSEVLARLRNDWEAAFMFFLWAGKQTDYAHSVREYHSMIAILGKMRKFDTAWALIDEMRGVKTGKNLVTPHTLMIMIRRYCAVHDVAKAINTFYAYKKFKFEVGLEEFQDLLSALCRYKNVKDAEHLLFCNKDVYPINTKSINIILNGWCNIVGDLTEGKRIWRNMKEKGTPRDVYSYASIMSCFSKGGNVYAVFKLFDEMKVLGIEPDRKVYNAVIHALAKGNLLKEARNLMKKMEEKGMSPNSITYNSLIMPLCKRRELGEAKDVFNEMIERGMYPTVRTYHAFFRILRTCEQVFELLETMYSTRCYPCHDTYSMLIRKFCRWREIDSVFKLWSEMSKNGLEPDRSSYIVLIHGLFFNGKLEEAYKYYIEMKEKDLVPEPKIEKMIQAWVESKQEMGLQKIDSDENKVGMKSEKIEREKDFLREPEKRRIIRERGFSLE